MLGVKSSSLDDQRQGWPALSPSSPCETRHEHRCASIKGELSAQITKCRSDYNLQGIYSSQWSKCNAECKKFSLNAKCPSWRKDVPFRPQDTSCTFAKARVTSFGMRPMAAIVK